MTPTLRDEARLLDAADPLAPFRARFCLPDGVIYLDGNSLGPLTMDARDALRNCVEQEWGMGLIRSWNDAGWIDLSARTGARIARLLGAAEASVMVCDSTSINVFKALAGAVSLRPGRHVVLTDADNFPTDLYMAQGMARWAQICGGDLEVRAVARPDLPAALDDSVLALLLTEVDYRTGERLDVATLTRAAHQVGALSIVDLAHSAGAFPVDVTQMNVDFAVGCGYKYLNGGPGAPAFLYVAPRHQGTFFQPLQGWLGHQAPFRFAAAYVPADGVGCAQVGTPPILSLTALAASMRLWDDVDMRLLRAKSLAMTALFIGGMARAAPAAQLLTPIDADRRGSQVAFAHPDAFAIVKALIARGVIGDFRAPDVMRFGFAPLYLSFEDVIAALATVADVMAKGEYAQFRDSHSSTVT
jgi:kynureninase